MELFTLGEGHYSEQDVKEAARALTGWTIREGEFFNARGRHDRGEKTFLGKTGKYDGDDVIGIILEQPAASRHLARKLIRYFVCEDPPAELVEAFSAVIRDNKFELKPSLRMLFKSEAFYAPAARYALIKSPVELVVGTFRLLEVPPRDAFGMASAARGMGQELLQPPNVKGWDGGQKWMSTATLFARYNFASGVLTGTESRDAARLMNDEEGRARAARFDRFRDEIQRHKDDYPGMKIPEAQVDSDDLPPFDPSAIIAANHLNNPDSVLNHCLSRVLQMKVDLAQRDLLRELLTRGLDRFDSQTPVGRLRVVALLNALMCTPEYQVK
jgi:uncharacterized protein (DUF1800 family)